MKRRVQCIAMLMAFADRGISDVSFYYFVHAGPLKAYVGCLLLK